MVTKTKKPAAKKVRADGVDVWCSHNDLIDVAALVPNPGNPNQHSERQVDILSRIIKAQGWRNPITVSNRSGFVVSGHGRLQAAIHAGLNTVPVDYQDFATEADEWAHLIADNRVAELSNIEPLALRNLITDANLDDLELTAYTDEELQELFAGLDMPGEDDLAGAFGKVPGEDAEFVTMTFTIPSADKHTVDEALSQAKSVMGDVDGNVNGHALVRLCAHHLTGE